MQSETLMEVVQELKSEIGYTDDFKEQSTDIRLMNYIRRGEAKLNEIAGTEIDFEADLVARGLLINYGRYENSQVSEHFATNYSKDLATLNAKYRVAEYLASEVDGNEES